MTWVLIAVFLNGGFVAEAGLTEDVCLSRAAYWGVILRSVEGFKEMRCIPQPDEQ